MLHLLSGRKDVLFPAEVRAELKSAQTLFSKTITSLDSELRIINLFSAYVNLSSSSSSSIACCGGGRGRRRGRGEEEEGEANLFCIPAIPEQHRTRGPGIPAHWDQMEPQGRSDSVKVSSSVNQALLLFNQTNQV